MQDPRVGVSVGPSNLISQHTISIRNIPRYQVAVGTKGTYVLFPVCPRSYERYATVRELEQQHAKRPHVDTPSNNDAIFVQIP